MNRALAQEIVGFLRVSGSPVNNLARLQEYPRENWHQASTWLDLSGLALGFYARLQRLGAEEAIPYGMAACLAKNCAEHRARIAAMSNEFNTINGRFEDAGVEYAALKGFTLVPDYCPDATLRPTYDYDYLISERAASAAEEVLRAAGFVRKQDRRAGHHAVFVPARPLVRETSTRRSLYSPALPRKVELHTSLWDEEELRVPLHIPQRPLDRRVRRQWDGQEFYALSEVDAFIFQALHTFQHILHNWCRLGWLWDVACFLERRSSDENFWTSLFASLEGNKLLTEVVAMVMTLASGVFHAPIPNAMKGRYRDAMRGQVSLWIERYGWASALDNFANNKYTLFLHREFVPSAAVWREIRKRRLLPLHRPNRVAGTGSPSNLPSSRRGWAQGRHVIQRFIHHAVSGARYALESRRWERMREVMSGPGLPAE